MRTREVTITRNRLVAFVLFMLLLFFLSNLLLLTGSTPVFLAKRLTLTTLEKLGIMAEAKQAEMPEIKSKHSLVHKFLTPEMWGKLKDHKTKTTSATLAQCIACAVQFDDQHCGIYAADEDCYKDYAVSFFFTGFYTQNNVRKNVCGVRYPRNVQPTNAGSFRPGYQRLPQLG